MKLRVPAHLPRHLKSQASHSTTAGWPGASPDDFPINSASMKRELRRRFDHDIELVRAVLRRWDPIGVFPYSDMSPARDEYDTYAPQILSLLYARASKTELADRLEQLRTVSIGMPAFRSRDEEAAEDLLALLLH